MKLGEGAKGIAYSVQCEAKDNDTICHMLKTSSIDSIVFYEVNGKFRVRDPQIIADFTKSLDKAEKYAAKTFKRKLFIDRKSVFDAEVTGIRQLLRIFGKDSARLTTFYPIAFMNRQIIALEADTDSGTFYSVFNERCENTLENIPMTNDDIVAMVEDLLKSFVILQKHKMAHTDVKPANIVKCHRNKYKLIDWEMLRDLSKHDYNVVNRASMSVLTSSPWSYYISGFPSFIAARYISSKVESNNPAYTISKEYKALKKFVSAEYEHILTWDMDKDALFDMYAYTIDSYSLASCVVYLCWKNKLSLRPFKTWVKKCLSAHPPENAQEAYKLWMKSRP